MDDKRNTDNAWIETLATVYADKHDLLHRLNIVSSEPMFMEAEWVQVRHDVSHLRSSQLHFLKAVRLNDKLNEWVDA